MAETTPDAKRPTEARADEHLRRAADVDAGETLGIDNTDTALSPEDTGYTPERNSGEPEPAGKGSDPPLDALP